ncbi:ATPase domain-containing protein [Stratiformator vulcanicus]|uniref:Circadian clock protein kinase KaiC n=1 Tax=Stratiformator vulcanicus TaxID=2527980 RepID=A0A517R0J5_9PLAN|nr:ATPase domain-containing protein [Stratiformator vulcanicus]QDT37417.1 Circadian clock protein kinase KaiC [Stratiformator vulcanicus]
MDATSNRLRPVEPIERLPIGISGFNEISGGGLVKGRSTLISGSSGSGKTLFCAETLFHLQSDRGMNAVFVSFEEKPEDIIRNVQSFDWSLRQFEADGRLILIDASIDHEVMSESGSYDLSGVLAQIEQAIDEIDADVVVLDSLAALFLQSSDDGIIRREIVRIRNRSASSQSTGTASILVTSSRTRRRSCSD